MISTAEGHTPYAVEITQHDTPDNSLSDLAVQLLDFGPRIAGLVPLTTKSASETARGLVELLTRFGSPAEVTTDRGTEFEGPFQALCEANAIDHRRTQPDHPQANGLAERMKAALRKHCRSTQSNDTWDKALPWLALAYRCSPQASTRYSPYKLLYGVDPIIPPAVRPRFEEHELAFTGDGSEQAYAEALLQRSEWLRRHAPAAAGNLLIAQHRDTQRYALTRSGGYRARALEFVPGDYVYLRNANPDNTLEMPVRDQVLRVEHVGDMGVAALVGRDTARLRARVEQLVPCHLPNLDPIQDARLLRTSNDLECEVCHSPQQPSRMLLCDGCGTGWHLRCLTPPLSKVPPGAWMCPGCVELGKAPPTGPAPQRPSAGPVLFPNADTRRRDAEAATLDGVSVVRAVPGPAGTPRQLQNGTLRFRGPLSRPFYFMVEWPGGSAEAITLADAKRLQRQTVPSSPASAPAQGGEPTAKRRVQPRR